MKVLVTGGAGFIGSHIVDQLIQHEYEVAVIDNLVTGDVRNLHPKAKLYITDITDTSVNEVFQLEKPEILIHQAAQVDVQKSLQDPKMDAMVNIFGTLNLLEMAKQYSVQKIIYASSCAVYGDPISIPISEEHPAQPISLYGQSKWLGEHYIVLYNRLYELDYTILRYANVYGPRQGVKGEGGVVSIFVQKMIQGKPPIIYGDGNQTRDFIFVKDVARANLLAITNGSQQTLNISTGCSTSINELSLLLRKMIDARLSPIYANSRFGDIIHSLLDPERAKIHLNWEATFSLEDGLRETVQFFAKMINHE